MLISGTEPSSVILSQTCIKKLKSNDQKCQNKLKQVPNINRVTIKTEYCTPPDQ